MEGTKIDINIATIGNSQSGKSTTLGRLILNSNGKDFDMMTSEELMKLPYNKNYALIGDKRFNDRNIEQTANISYSNIETLIKKFTLINTPGLRKYIKNMISGTFHGDAALLVVSALNEEFEDGMSRQGMTKEHVLIAFTFGIKQIIVGVNKMDTCNWNEKRFYYIKENLSKELLKIGYPSDSTYFIPYSGLKGDNLINKSRNLSWYKGPTLLEAMNNLQMPKRDKDKPLRITVSFVQKIGGIGTVACGKVECGILKPDTMITINPNNMIRLTGSLEKNYKPLVQAIPGDYIGFNIKKTMTNHMDRGFVVGDYSNEPPKEADSFIANIIVLNHPNGIKRGYCPTLDCHNSHTLVRLVTLLKKIDRKTGKELEINPTLISNNEAATVEFSPLKPMVIEKYLNYPSLGRFILRDHNQVIAVGIVLDVKHKIQEENKV